MRLKEFADKANLSIYDMECMLRGNSNLVLQDRFHVSMGEIDVFISQNLASEEFAKLLGVSVAAAQEFGAALGRDGRVGFFIGLLMRQL